MIYLDNAATTFAKPRAVYETSDRVFRYFSANAGRGGHRPSLKALDIITKARITASEFFGISKPENIVFTFGCTDSLNILIKGLFQHGDHIITTCYEHNSVLRPLEYMKSTSGIDYSVVFPDFNGEITPQMIENEINEQSKAIIVNYVSNVTGYRQNIEEIGILAKKYNLLFIVDCAQAAGTQIINAEKMNVDYIACAGHKGLYGPQGIGILGIENEKLPFPIRHGGTGSHSLELTQPNELPEYLESGTLAVQNVAALEQGILFVKSHREQILKHEIHLANMLADGLSSIKKVKLYLPSEIKSGVISFNIGDVDANTVSDILDRKYSICCRGGFHCAPLVHRYLNTENQGTVRASISVFNSEADILALIRAVKEISM